MRLIRRILLIFLFLSIGYLIFNCNKVNAALAQVPGPKYDGDVAYSTSPHLSPNSTGIDIDFMDLVEYNDGKGTPKPYGCIDRKVLAQCGYASHYYSVTSVIGIGSVEITGEAPWINSATGTVKWSKYSDTVYKVGPYKVNFSGSISSIVIDTDGEDATLSNGQKNGNLGVDTITSGTDFYIYIRKGIGIKKVNGVKVSVESKVTSKQLKQYILECYAVSPVGYGHDNRDCANGPTHVQRVEHYQYDSSITTASDSVDLPGALGVIQLQIVKHDKYRPDILVQGAKYELWSGGKLQYSGTTGANGIANIADVLIGDYTIKEVAVPYNYELKGYATWNGTTYNDVTNMNGSLEDDTRIDVYNESYMDLGGKVFIDKPSKKDKKENGYYNSDGDPPDSPLEGITVTLYSSEPNSQPETMFTDKDGNYKFLHKSKAYEYYIKFTYNGQIYEPTTYNVGLNSDSPDRKLRSYATETPSERDNFNNKFAPVDSSHQAPLWTDKTNSEFLIDAYTGDSGLDNLLKFDKDSTSDELLNINLGLLEREKFDLNLRKDLVNVELKINGKEHTYEYPGGELPLDVEIRGTDVKRYEREIARSDLGYSGHDKLEVYITYVIQIQNESQGQITGYVTDLNDYYDMSYLKIESWDENNQTINWTTVGTVSENGKEYNKMHTTDLANVGITDKKYIYIRYQLEDETIRELFDSNTESTEENLAEIAGYRNTYTVAKQDLNGRTMTNAGEVAGLIDIDSTPDNLNPVSSEVQDFIEKSKTDEYQNLSSEEKSNQSREIFEDDADYAPGLRIIPTGPRTISGTVFEDSPIADKLDENERIGDGELTGDDTRRINQVHVELIAVKENTAGEWEVDEDVMNYYESSDGNLVSDVDVRTNTNGEYIVSGYIPGDYIIRFTYGDQECLINPQNDDEMYTGQDYKSTLWFSENYEGENNDWYKDETPRTNDATDNQDRREDVNSYSRTLQYSNAIILDSDKDSSNVAELADKTYMYADTALMSMQIEYLGEEEEDYDVNNVDFGIIERPRTKITLVKNVERVKLSAVDGSTIFDANDTAPGLTWQKNKYNTNSRELEAKGFVQGTVDENLLYGSTAQVTYTFTIINDSEIDYNDLGYYERGEKPEDEKLNKINTNKMIDYIPNTFKYIKETSDAQGEIIISEYSEIPDNAVGITKPQDETLWQVKKNIVEGITLDANEYRISGNELLKQKVFEDVNNNIDTVIQFPGTSNYPSEITSLINSDPTQSKGLIAPNGEIKLKNALTITRVISKDGDLEVKEGEPEQNVAEIIQFTIDNGRRPYYESEKDIDDITGDTESGGGSGDSEDEDDPTKFDSVHTVTTETGEIIPVVTETPGNANPMDPKTWFEIDTAISEEVQFIPPFGNNKKAELIIIIVIALGVLGIGIYIIKKKVLLK